MARKKAPWAVKRKPPGEERVTPIEKIGQTDNLRVVALANEMYGLDTHWCGKTRRTIPCLEDQEKGIECPHHSLPRRWKAWLCCYYHAKRKIVLVELTDLSVQGLYAQLGELPLRGAVLMIRRERQEKRAPVVIEYLSHEHRMEPLPPATSEEATLKRLWKDFI